MARICFRKWVVLRYFARIIFRGSAVLRHLARKVDNQEKVSSIQRIEYTSCDSYIVVSYLNIIKIN